MPRIEWQPQMVIDDGVIDGDHRFLIAIVNRFASQAERFARVEDALELLVDLRFYARTHFEREERLQALAGFPLHAVHKREHADLIRQVNSLLHLAEQASAEELEDLSRETADLLYTWLMSHILQSDLAMKPYVAEMRLTACNLEPLASLHP